MTVPLLTIILVLVASLVGASVRWVILRLGGNDWLSVFLALLAYGLILLLVKIT